LSKSRYSSSMASSPAFMDKLSCAKTWATHRAI
jgi:hypothetical protein